MKNFNEYINEVAKVKDELEHSGRTFLQNLLTEFTNTHKINIIHESKRDKKGRGAPDFKFLFNDTEIGYLENKKIGEDLDDVLKSDQIRKYKTLTDNLILTDYIRWIWIYKDNVIKDIRLCEKTILEQKVIKLNETNCNQLSDLINDFLSQKPQEIIKARDLAEKLSKPTRTIKDEIYDIVKGNVENTNSRIIGTYNVFKAEISENITPEDFADAFAQTLTYSLFLTKITSTSQEKLTLSNIANEIPKSFALIKDILTFINEIEDYPRLKPYIERIFHIINHTNALEVVSDLQNDKNKDNFEDPYIYFYENFLESYNKKQRKDHGVWYTPKPVVRAIIDNINEILKQDFELTDGIANKNVKLLDFACGTGTFLLEVYEKILDSLSTNLAMKDDIIKNHILKNIFGFELLIPAYCVSHLKLSQYLKSKNYNLQSTERIGVYFTNTLENRTEKGQGQFEGFFPAIAKEGKQAQQIKDDKSILVITGNPPYSGTSQNNFKHIQDLIQPYFPKDNIKERNPKWLQDDYVKFIRFAEDKIEKAGKGIVGIITSHSFIDNPTFRSMRQHLMDTFDKIYIIDLHGNTKKKEKCHDGTQDQNVFDIQQGVAISFFIKTSDKKECEVHHLDIFGKRMPKFEQISEIDLQKSVFTKINPSAPFYLFLSQNDNLREEYEKGWSLREVWREMTTGIVSARDNICFHNKKDDLLNVLNDFKNLEEMKLLEKYKTKNGRDWTIQGAKSDIGDINEKNIIQINYRPFDNKWTHYTGKGKGFVQDTIENIMQHFLNKDNIGLVCCRQVNQEFYHCFVSEKIIESCLVSNKTREITSIAPLYLYKSQEQEIKDDIAKLREQKKAAKDANIQIEIQEKILSLQGSLQKASTEVVKKPNFKPEFAKMVAEKFENPSPEQVLGYIYAVLHSPTYRTKYLEFLKIDFPRINFDVSQDKFKKLSAIGSELIELHLMKKRIDVSNNDKMQCDKGKTPNSVVGKISYNEQKSWLYINDVNYFENVSPEVWNFKIGGYQVLDKYLKSRKDMDITSDAEHIVKIIKTLEFTIQKMREIDNVIC